MSECQKRDFWEMWLLYVEQPIGNHSRVKLHKYEVLL